MQHVYTQQAYAAQLAIAPIGNNAPPAEAQASLVVKHLRVAAWVGTPRPETLGLGELLTNTAGDLIKLRKNYLLYEPQVVQRQWSEACSAQVQGVLLIRLLELAPQPPRPAMQVAMELYRCVDGALLWRGEARGAHPSTDPSLSELTSHYAASLGSSAVSYAAPAFVLLKELVSALPDPQLTDSEIVEKIERS